MEFLLGNFDGFSFATSTNTPHPWHTHKHTPYPLWPSIIITLCHTLWASRHLYPPPAVEDGSEIGLPPAILIEQKRRNVIVFFKPKFCCELFDLLHLYRYSSSPNLYLFGVATVKLMYRVKVGVKSTFFSTFSEQNRF